jgi:hypothetical protein
MQEILQKISQALNAEPDVAFAYLFGSVAKGRSGPLSDVDVAVYLSPTGDARSRFKRRLQLMSKLSKTLKRGEVDVVPLQDAPVDLAFEILKHGKLIFSKDDEAKVTFVFEALRKYHDEAWRRKFEWEVIREELEKGTYGLASASDPREAQKAS